ncbi:formimidoylglutamate deiminase [Stella humosa]|uniref:Formimidoylglutamate deiminase n=1 Tax=Stella humosa TaxID=94 RepID=A0A3N1KYC3_9PROT|nr:formimidoylglutamate deiminase [Stella humosa]ROP83206.1 formimidoylglutamate deiminase [Stella humosa]BBK30015.1 formimidoylglutamate deiminase [Stella humosa]
MQRHHFAHALLPEGWADDVTIAVDDGGWIRSVTAGAPADGNGHAGVAVPGMPNLHSHAFQRGMAGLAERRGAMEGNFWGWREVMYRFLAVLDPDDVAAIAAQAYVEMVESGFTAVAEFHYLHHDPQGRPYADAAEMAGAIGRAAVESGIGLTHLPVFYGFGRFGGGPADPGQRRFVTTPDRFARLVEASRSALAAVPDMAVGVAPHSVRAVTAETLAAVVAEAAGGPVHIHVAEQQREVDECLAWCGRRPVDWLLDEAAVDGRWCLVHATHVTPAEVARMAAARAVVGLCPITEGNLGDGIFPVPALLEGGGLLGIGSDSNVRIDVAEELRLLEYGQRLRDEARNVVAAGAGQSTGRALFELALDGGARALGRRVGRLAPGYRADFVLLDDGHPALAGRSGDHWLDAWVFAADGRVVKAVWIGGRPVVADGRHVARDAVRRRFGATMRRLMAA